MMKNIRHMILAGMLLGVFAPSMSAQAGEPPLPAGDDMMMSLQMDFNSRTNERRESRFERYAQQKTERRISASRAKSIALRHVRGASFINIRPMGDTYRVRVQQKNGRIIDVYVDARTGRVKN